MNNRKNAYAEVYSILQELEEKEYAKMPIEILEVIKQNRNTKYDYELDEDIELKNQPMLPETKAILFNLFRDYLATPKQKEAIIKIQAKARRKNEIKKKQLYSTELFINRTKHKAKE